MFSEKIITYGFFIALAAAWLTVWLGILENPVMPPEQEEDEGEWWND